MSDFDPKAYLAEPAETPKGSVGGFDPKAYLAEGPHGMDVYDTAGAGKAALEHTQNALTMGYLPQIQGAIQKLMPDPSADTDAKLKAQGFNVSQPDFNSYVDTRDETIKRLADESAAHPIISGAGTVAGTLLGGAGIGAGMKALGVGAKALQLAQAAKAAEAAGDTAGAARLAQAAMAARLAGGVATGATMGAVANPGDTEGEINPIQLDERAHNAKVGGITGGLVQGAIEAAPAVGKAIGHGARKIGATISGVAQPEVNTYVDGMNRVDNMIEQSGGNMTAAADKARQETQSAIRATRQKLSQQVGKALDSAGDTPNLHVGQVLDALDQAKARINPTLNPEGVAEIDEMGKRIFNLADENGNVSPTGMHQIKEFLQDRASGSYMKGGQIFQAGKDAAQAAKSGAAIARRTVNAAVPEVAQANNQLSYLHDLEGQMNRNLIAPGKPDAALLAAGSGNNPRNAAMLERLDQAAGTNLSQTAKDLAAARTFADPALLPHDATGKSATRMLLAAGAGHMLAGPMGYAAGALASPAALKAGIQIANRVVVPVAQGVTRFAANNPAIVQRAAQGLMTPPQNQSATDTPIDQKSLGIFKQNPGLLEQIADPSLKASIKNQINRMPADGQGAPAVSAAPLTGESKWATQGAQNLGIQGDTLQKVMADPKGKQLLIQASDFPVGHPDLKRIKDKLQKGFSK